MILSLFAMVYYFQAIVEAAGGCPGSNPDFGKERIGHKTFMQSQLKRNETKRNNHSPSTSLNSNAASAAHELTKGRSHDDGCLRTTEETAEAMTENHNILSPPVSAFFRYFFKQQNSKGNCLGSRHPTQQATAPPPDSPCSHAERKSKPSSQPIERKMEKLEQSSSKTDPASAESRPHDDGCMNENGKNAKAFAETGLDDRQRVSFHN